jgi:hypothetical protein
MMMEKHRIEKDWENHKTRNACIDFLNWHNEWGVTLLQIEPLYGNEIRRSIEEATTFQFKSMEIGLWKNKYLIQLDEYQWLSLEPVIPVETTIVYTADLWSMIVFEGKAKEYLQEND